MLEAFLSRLPTWLKPRRVPDQRTLLHDGDSVLASVKDGKIIAYTADIALSHREFVTRMLGTLPDGAWVGTVRKFGGQVIALNSRTYYGNQLPAPQDALDVIRASFR
jgi:hypothetical protein